MTGLRTAVALFALGASVAVFPASNAATTGLGQQGAGKTVGAPWTEVKWPFPLDQWGTGRAFQCRAEDCGSEITLYLRPKLGFCNCTTGVSDDAELDRVGDLELFSERFEGLSDG